MLYMVREYARSGTEVFLHISEIRNFPGIYMAIWESLAYAGTLHSSMPEDISGIFRRFPYEKMKECATGRIELVS